jgi:ABC-type sugar transport system ATPase subunit
LFLEQRQRGCAILLVSEDLDELTAIADRIAVIYKGEIAGCFRVESVPEGADAERVLRQLARSGHKDRCDQLRLYGYNVKGGRTLS